MFSFLFSPRTKRICAVRHSAEGSSVLFLELEEYNNNKRHTTFLDLPRRGASSLSAPFRDIEPNIGVTSGECATVSRPLYDCKSDSTSSTVCECRDTDFRSRTFHLRKEDRFRPPLNLRQMADLWQLLSWGTNLSFTFGKRDISGEEREREYTPLQPVVCLLQGHIKSNLASRFTAGYFLAVAFVWDDEPTFRSRQKRI